MSKKKSVKTKAVSKGSKISLTDIYSGQKCRIIEIGGGHGLKSKLEALGIIEGQKIIKKSEQWLKGPVLLQHEKSIIAIGFSMASNIIVEIIEDKH